MVNATDASGKDHFGEVYVVVVAHGDAQADHY